MKHLKYVLIPLFALLAMLAVACGDDDESTPAASSSLSGDITVFAASSLTDAFEEIGEAFEAENADVGLEFNFAGSQDLRTQLEQGAPADIFASANGEQMQLAQDADLVAGEPVVFVHNRLVVIVPKANEAGVETLQDLATPDLKIVIASADVPVGKYTLEFLDKASADPAFDPGYKDAVLANVVSEESNVKQVVSRVQLDEVDAGVVYSSDVTPEVAEDVTIIEIPDELNTLADYPIAVTSDAGSPDVAQAFTDFVLSDAGQTILGEHGYIPVD